jgi:hypothetical protein
LLPCKDDRTKGWRIWYILQPYCLWPRRDAPISPKACSVAKGNTPSLLCDHDSRKSTLVPSARDRFIAELSSARCRRGKSEGESSRRMPDCPSFGHRTGRLHLRGSPVLPSVGLENGACSADYKQFTGLSIKRRARLEPGLSRFAQDCGSEVLSGEDPVRMHPEFTEPVEPGSGEVELDAGPAHGAPPPRRRAEPTCCRRSCMVNGLGRRGTASGRRMPRGGTGLLARSSTGREVSASMFVMEERTSR